MHPRSCGKNIEDFSEEELLKLPRSLTEREKADPHAKYFELEAEAPRYLLEALESGPMDPAKAFMPHEYGRYMNNSGYCEVENGFCILPNGVSYAAALIKQDGVTDEMIEHFNSNFCLTDDLFYKTWYPGWHVRHFENGCLEDFGWGLRNMRFDHPIAMEDIGIDVEKAAENDPACIYIGGVGTKSHNLSGRKTGVRDTDMILKYHRKTPNGREMRVRLWYGLSIKNGQYTYEMPVGGQPLEVARDTMNHIIYEHCREVALIRRFWEDSH